MKKLLTFLCVAVFFFACSDVPDNYLQTASGLTYSYVELGDGEVAEEDDYVRFAYEVKNENDSMLYSSRMLVHLIKAVKNGNLEEGLLMMKVGDKIDFLLNPKAFYDTYMQQSVPSTVGEGKIKVQVKVLEILSDLAYQKRKNEFYQKLSQARMDTSAHTEIKRIEDFINENKMPVKVSQSGLAYFFINDVENAKKVTYGKTLYLHYRGKFFDGREFNSTMMKGTPQDMIFGQEMQVIQGIEEALSMMNEGDKMGLVIPSSLAYGSKGSSTGIVPPNTPVYYEVEVIKVN
jgi:FKBP-type peptidyl-prolyl cis-trans isomerase FkpA